MKPGGGFFYLARQLGRGRVVEQRGQASHLDVRGRLALHGGVQTMTQRERPHVTAALAHEAQQLRDQV